MVGRNNNPSQTSDVVTADASVQPRRDGDPGRRHDGARGAHRPRRHHRRHHHAPERRRDRALELALVGTVRPWAACESTIADGLATAGKVVAAPLDNKWGICGDQLAAATGARSTSTAAATPPPTSSTGPATATRSCPRSPALPADPGVSRSQPRTAFRALVNTPILIPVAQDYVDSANGNNGAFDTRRFALVTVCGAYYQNQAYSTTLSGAPSVCWQNPNGSSRAPARRSTSRSRPAWSSPGPAATAARR